MKELMDTPLSTEQYAAVREAADESSYSASEWVEAIAALDTYLKKENRSASFPTKLGYVSCCAELGARDVLRPSLKNLVEDMLELHGFAGEQES